MNSERLIQMANDIAAFFSAEPDPAAAAIGVETHLRKFWAPRMREQLISYWRDGGTELTPLAAAAVALLAQNSNVGSNRTR